MMKPLLILAVVLMTGGVEAKGATYQLIGHGLISCGSWTEYRRNNMAVEPLQWVLGFLSGVGFSAAPTVDPLNNVDAKGVAAWIDNHCQAHPLDSVATAPGAFVHQHPR